MNNHQYIKALKKALVNMDKQSRDDIVMEIQSHIEELGDQQSLQDRFGPAVQLAQQYLDGEQVVEPLQTKVVSVGRKVFLGIGIAVPLVIVLAVALIWWMSGDEFNYADETATELDSNDANWRSVSWDGDVDISIEQAKVVLYWHKAESVRWNCKQSPNVMQGQLKIRHDSCLIFLPERLTKIDANQGSIVLVRPEKTVQMTVKQSDLRIAENGTQYRYDLTKNRSKVSGLVSHEGAGVDIAINAYESSIERYEYR
ncbi:MAG: HAAS signaling domain-containing protein [Arenicella sp.]